MLCKKNEKNCINATRRAPNRARHFFCLYAALVCGVCFALPAFADGDPLTVVNNLSAKPRPQPAQSGISHACGRAGHYVCKRNLGLDHGHGGIKSRQRIVKPKPRG